MTRQTWLHRRITPDAALTTKTAHASLLIYIPGPSMRKLCSLDEHWTSTSASTPVVIQECSCKVNVPATLLPARLAECQTRRPAGFGQFFKLLPASSCIRGRNRTADLRAIRSRMWHDSDLGQVRLIGRRTDVLLRDI